MAALPAINSLSQAADPALTVFPYLPTSPLTALPAQFFAALSSAYFRAYPGGLAGLVALYANTNPLVSSVTLAAVLCPIFLLVAEVNRNYSQVDRMWSILPALFNAHYAVWARVSGLHAGAGEFGRVDAVVVASVIWSMRLTFNYWRKGGYSIGSEDYRWEILQRNIGAVGFFIFNVVFISSAQVFLLVSITFPTYVLLLTERVTGPALQPLDFVFAGWMVAMVAISAVADQQQWNYQNAKKEYQRTAKVPSGFKREDLDIGFNTSGLWADSRHPNFLAEQTVWVTLYIWSCAVTGTYYNWSGIGAVGYIVLFQGSTWFTELVSSGKYPEYREYQRQVGMFVPLPGHGWSPVAKSQEKVEELKKDK